MNQSILSAKNLFHFPFAPSTFSIITISTPFVWTILYEESCTQIVLFNLADQIQKANQPHHQDSRLITLYGIHQFQGIKTDKLVIMQIKIYQVLTPKIQIFKLQLGASLAWSVVRRLVGRLVFNPNLMLRKDNHQTSVTSAAKLVCACYNIELEDDQRHIAGAFFSIF